MVVVCVWGGGDRVCGGGVKGGGGGARVRMCAWECPCSYFTFSFCKHTPVGSTLHFTESKKLNLYSSLQIALNFSSYIYSRIY